MAHKNSSTGRSNLGITAIFTTILIAVLVMPAYGAVSSETSYDVEFNLSTTGTDNWTQADAYENISFTISNSNSSIEIDEINITVPKVSANSIFAINMTTNDTNKAAWGCYNYTADAVSNVSVLTCNASTDNMTSGESLVIWFWATASSSSAEAVHQWNVTAYNASNGFPVTVNVSSGIDGSVPYFDSFGKNTTTFNGSIYLWSRVNDMSVESSGVSMEIVNASNTSSDLGGSLSENCTALTSSQWNCTAVWQPSTDGNYTFNVTATDDVGYSNETTYDSWFIYDTAAPTVTLTTPTRNLWDTDGDVEFNFSAFDYSLLDTCTLWTNSSGWGENESISSPSRDTTYNVSLYSIPEGSYIWNFWCNDTEGYSGFSAQNYTVNLGNRSNLMIYSIVQHGSTAPYDDYNLVVNVTVKNNGTANAENDTVLKVYFDDDDSPISSPIKVSTATINGYELNYTESHTQQFMFSLNASAERYYVLAVADSGSVESEQYENDNTLTESFYTVLNVTINSILMGATSFPALNPDDEVIFNMTVLYPNGTPVTGLNALNFTIYDSWDEDELGREETDPLNSSVVLSAFDDSNDNIGEYTFNYSAVGMQIDVDDDLVAKYAEYGSHTVNVKVEDNSTGNYYTDTTEDELAYNITAPFIKIDGENLPSSIEVGYDDEDRVVEIINDGNEDTSATITLLVDNEGGYIDLDDWNDTDNQVTTNGLAVGQIKEMDGTLQGVTAGTANFTLNVTFTHEGKFYWFKFIEEIEVETAGGNGDSDDDGTSTTTTSSYECTRDSDCDSDEECKSLECVEIECEEGYVASDHECKLKSVYELSITKFTSQFTLTQGDAKNTSVTVENTGNKDVTASLDVTLNVDGLVVNVSPYERDLEPDDKVVYLVTFSLSEDSKIGIFEGYFKATSDFSTGKDTKTFNFTINPLPQTIAKLKAKHQNYTSVVISLLSRLESMKSGLSGSNLTEVEEKSEEIDALFNKLKTAMDEENYPQASMYMDELDSLISSATSLLGSGPVGDIWSAVIMWVVIAVVAIGAVGLLIYMMVPPQGYTLGRGYSPQGKGSVTDKIKAAVMSVRGKMGGSRPTSAGQIVSKYRPSAYGSAYNRLPSSYTGSKSTMSERMKNALRRKGS